MKIFVIAPDKESGDAFGSSLRNRGVETEMYYPKIEPRVIGEEMNTDPKVERDLAAAIGVGQEKGYTRVVIACNTLQLWLQKAIAILGDNVRNKVYVTTTFDVLRHEFEFHSPKPVWLGTTPLARAIPREHFPTLISLGLDDVQKLVQEIVWRTKGVVGSSVSTAPTDISQINDPVLLRKRVKLLIDLLKKNGIWSAIMGCTELPIAFGKYASERSRTGLELIDPAEIMARHIVDHRD